eukprot:COSAG02_NODE_3305_length_6966_cov_3.711664_3_plen_94_part_00
MQAIVQRVVAELQRRGYNVWLDLERMKGSVMVSDLCGIIEPMCIVVSGLLTERSNRAHVCDVLNCILRGQDAMSEAIEVSSVFALSHCDTILT